MKTEELREKILELAEGERPTVILSALNAAIDIVLFATFSPVSYVYVAEQLHKTRLKTIDKYKALHDAERKKLKKS